MPSAPASPAELAIGLDIGGANTKAALVDGGGTALTASVACELWREPDSLAGAIASVVATLDPDTPGGAALPVALTTTAELADVFASKREGVLAILATVERALPGRRLRAVTTGGELVGLDRARAQPLRCAAANWAATATLLARDVADAVLIDCGGTTTDVIPLSGGGMAASGRTDLERLRSGELVYTGALRTNVAAILERVTIGGRPCRVAAEQFAIAADAHRLRGTLTADQCTCSFPDGRGASDAEVRARLARVVCADPEQLTDSDLEGIAAAVHDAQVAAIAAAIEQVTARTVPDAGVIAVGTGAFLARAAAARAGRALTAAPRWLAGAGGEVAAAAALSVLGREAGP